MLPQHKTMRRSNRGFVLVTSLIFLVVLTALVLMAMRGALFGEKVGSNERDLFVAREAAELALRDAEHDIVGERFDSLPTARKFCAALGAATCSGNLRPTGSRPDTNTIGNFWTGEVEDANLNLTVTDAARPASVNGTNLGFYSSAATAACGKPLWQAADWDVDSPPVAKRCADGSAIVRAVVYGEFTGAPNLFGANARLPRYIVDVLEGRNDLGIPDSGKVFFRITAVGFGRLPKSDGSLTSVTLQSVYSANQ